MFAFLFAINNYDTTLPKHVGFVRDIFFESENCFRHGVYNYHKILYRRGRGETVKCQRIFYLVLYSPEMD